MTIARRFNGGRIATSTKSPQGTAEILPINSSIQYLPEFFGTAELDVALFLRKGVGCIAERRECARRLYRCDLPGIVRRSVVPCGDLFGWVRFPAVKTAGYSHPSRFAGLGSRPFRI